MNVHSSVTINNTDNVLTFLPTVISKEEKSRPKVTVFERTEEGRKKVLELKLIMVAEK